MWKAPPRAPTPMLTKVHHAAIDGVSGVDLMHALHTVSPEPEKFPDPDPWEPERVPSQFGLFARGYARAFTLPLRQARAVVKSAPGMLNTVRGAVKGDFNISGMMKTPRTRFNDVISAHRIIDGKVIFNQKK